MPIMMGRMEIISKNLEKNNSRRNCFWIFDNRALREQAMREYFDTVIKKLEAELEANSKENSSFRQICLAMELVKGAFRQLDQDEEFRQEYANCHIPLYIEANKESFPALLSQYFFYELSYALEINKRYSSEEEHDRYCKRLSVSIREFFCDQREFITYYYSGRTDRDHDFFLNTDLHPMPDLARGIAALHKNGGALRVAMLLAFERFMLPAKSGPKSAAAEEELNRHRVTWDRDLVDLAELVLGQYECRAILVDGKPAKQEFLIKLVAAFIGNVDEGQLAAAVRGVTSRKKGPSVFHRELTAWLDKRKDRLLEK